MISSLFFSPRHTVFQNLTSVLRPFFGLPVVDLYRDQSVHGGYDRRYLRPRQGDLREIESATSELTVQGARYSESAQRMIKSLNYILCVRGEFFQPFPDLAFDSQRPATTTPARRATFEISVSGLASSRMTSARLPCSTVPVSDNVPKYAGTLRLPLCRTSQGVKPQPR